MSFRKAILAFIASVAVLAASSCVDRGGEDLVVNITTSIGEEGIEFDMNAQDTVFTLTSNCDWTVEMEVENPWENEAEEFEQNPWLTVSPVSGEASEQPVTITVAADANTSDAAEITYDRAVIVYFRTDREQFASVRVFQEGQERKPNAVDTISISELRQMAPVAQDSVVTITDPYIIKGVVVSSRDPQTVSNNNIYIQDGTEPHSGLLVYSSAFSSCNFGDEVEITITDGTLEYYYGQLEFKPASTDDVVVVGKQENPEAAEIEGASLVNGDYEGQYVKMFAQVVEGDLGKTMGDSPEIETEDGSSFLMYSRSNTPWAGDNVPQGAGTVYGLVGSYNGVYQLVPSRESDFAGLTEERFTGRPAVTTGEAQLSDDKSSMTVTGTYSYAGDANDVTEVGVAYKLVTAEEFTKVKAESVATSFTVTIQLESGAYEYYAYVMIGEREYQGETLTVTTEETAVSVAELVAAILDGTIEDDAPLATLGAYLEGIVAAGNQSANYNGKYSLVDGTGEEATGIVLYRMYDVELNPGDRVRINLANATFENYFNLREIKFNEGTDINAQVEVLESGVAFDVPELTVAELLSGDWQGQYVKVKGVRSAADSLLTWTDPGKSTNRTFTDGTDEFQVRTQGNAEWAEEGIDPEVTTDLGCVVEVYSENVQVYAATYDDIKAFSVPAGDEPDEPEVPAEPVVATVAEFIAAPVSTDVWYQLTGKIVSIANPTYGNITIEDETGDVYIYGLTATKVESNDQSFSSLGLEVNDVVTLVTLRGEHNGEPQGGGQTPAYYVTHEDGEAPQHPVPTKATVAEVLAAEVNPDVWYEVTGTISDIENTTYGNFVITDETGSIDVYGLTKEWVAGGNNDKSFSQLGLKEGDILTLAGTRDEYNGEPQINGTAYYISHEPGEAPAPENPVIEGTAGDGVYTSSIDLTQNTSSDLKNYASTFVVGGTEYPAVKIGASKSAGSYSFNLGKAGSSTLSMYAVAWTGKQTNVLVKISGGGTINGASQVELACVPNTGLSGGGNKYTITFGDKDFYTMNIEGATENTVITVTTEGMQDNRAGFTGVNVK